MNGMLMSEPMMPMPRFEIPREMAIGLEGKGTGDKIKAVVNYEVTDKNETEVGIVVESILFKTDKRVRS